MSLTGVWYCFNLKTRLPTPTSIPSPLPLLAGVIASWNTQPKIVFLQVWPYDSVVTHMTQFESVSDKSPTPLWGHDCPKCHHWFCSWDEAWEVIYRIHLTGIFRRGWDLQLQRKFPKMGRAMGEGMKICIRFGFQKQMRNWSLRFQILIGVPDVGREEEGSMSLPRCRPPGKGQEAQTVRPHRSWRSLRRRWGAVRPAGGLLTRLPAVGQGSSQGSNLIHG